MNALQTQKETGTRPIQWRIWHLVALTSSLCVALGIGRAMVLSGTSVSMLVVFAFLAVGIMAILAFVTGVVIALAGPVKFVRAGCFAVYFSLLALVAIYVLGPISFGLALALEPPRRATATK